MINQYWSRNPVYSIKKKIETLLYDDREDRSLRLILNCRESKDFRHQINELRMIQARLRQVATTETSANGSIHPVVYQRALQMSEFTGYWIFYSKNAWHRRDTHSVKLTSQVWFGQGHWLEWGVEACAKISYQGGRGNQELFCCYEEG